jgi:hypothetical protein
MRHILTITVALVLALPAVAAAETLSVSRSECRKLVRHEPSADVAYRPGVGVRGRKVAPADLGGGFQIAPPDEIEIPITVELDKTIGAAASGLYKPEANIGKVVFKNSRAWYNGQPLETGASAEVVAACRRLMKSDR